MLPEYPNFKTLELSDLGKIISHFKNHKATVCELAVANLFIWQEFDHPRLTIINDNLCILITPLNEPPFFLEPIGKNKLIETVAICLKDSGRLARLSEEFLFHLPIENYHVLCSRDQSDYVYERRALAELKGKKYDGKRNHINSFERRHQDYIFGPLKPEQKESCLNLFENWFAMRKESRHFPRLAYTSQKAAVEKAFEYFNALKLIGEAIIINGQFEGFILGSPLNEETITVHFLYALPNHRGIFQVLLWHACNNTFRGYKSINLEQDLGIPGLRKAKLSYQPQHIEKKFELKNK